MRCLTFCDISTLVQVSKESTPWVTLVTGWSRGVQENWGWGTRGRGWSGGWRGTWGGTNTAHICTLKGDRKEIVTFMAHSALISQLFTCWNVLKNHIYTHIYCQISNIRCIKSQNLNVSHLVLQLSLWNLLKPGVKSEIKMWLEQRRQAMFQLHLSDQQFHCLLKYNLY